MPIPTESKPAKPDVARRILDRVIQIQAACAAARTALGTDHGTLLRIPAYAAAFEREYTWAQGLYPSSELGPIIVSMLETDPARTWEGYYQAYYESFKLSLAELAGHIINVAAAFTPSINSETGAIEYTADPGAQVRADLSLLLDNVLANFG